MYDDPKFIGEIVANPDDDAPRLIYADWLEEQGDSRGEFIRVQCELGTLKKTQKRFKELAAREKELLNEHEAEWTQGFPFALRKCVFHRGFIEECSIALSNFVKHAEKLLSLTPLRVVTFTAVKNQYGKLAQVPQLSRLDSVDFKQIDDNAGEVRFAASPFLHGLKRIRCVGWPDEAMIALGNSEHTGTLEELDCHLGGSGLRAFSESAIAALAKSPHLAGLKRLIMPRCMKRAGIPHLCNATFAAGLQHLDIRRTDMDDSDFQLMVDSPLTDNLEELHATYGSVFGDANGIQGKSLISLAEKPKLSRFRKLNLSEHPLSADSIAAIGDSEYRARGTKFLFGNVRLTDREIQQLKERFGKTFGSL